MLGLFVRRGLIEAHVATDMLTWQAAGGFSANAAVRVEGRDRVGRERLLRYCARPPFALERLSIERAPAAEGGGEVQRVLYRLSRTAPDGRTVLRLSPLEFVDALAHLIPPPHVHRQRYHGILAPHARLRPLLTDWVHHAAASELPEPAPQSPDSSTRRRLPHLSPATRPTPRRISSPEASTAPFTSTHHDRAPRSWQHPPIPVGAPPRPHLRGVPARLSIL